MMKAQNKNRKHPTCSRCRFHGKKDIRVLQHQCPFRSCTCSSCILIKRRSVIYRAQKHLDKNEENSNEADSPAGSTDNAQSYNEKKSNMCSPYNGSNDCVDTRSLPVNYTPSNTFGTSDTVMSNNVNHPTHHQQHHQEWSNESIEQTSNHSSSINSLPSLFKSPITVDHHNHHYKIGDFQSLCTTFPGFKPSYLQATFEQCGKDFQKTIDKILESKWFNESESQRKSIPVAYQNNNEWYNSNECIQNEYIAGSMNNAYSPGSSGSVGSASSLYHQEGTLTHPIMAENYVNQVYHDMSYNHEQYNDCINQMNGSSGLSDEYCTQEYAMDGNDYYYYEQQNISPSVTSSQEGFQYHHDHNPNPNIITSPAYCSTDYPASYCYSTHSQGSSSSYKMSNSGSSRSSSGCYSEPDLVAWNNVNINGPNNGINGSNGLEHEQGDVALEQSLQRDVVNNF